MYTETNSNSILQMNVSESNSFYWIIIYTLNIFFIIWVFSIIILNIKTHISYTFAWEDSRYYKSFIPIDVQWCKWLNHLYVKNKTKLEHQCRKNDECINYCAIFHSIQWIIFSELFTNFSGKWCLFQGNGSNWITTSATKLCRLSW